ncbi:PAS domain-containing protein [Candidatus Sumerlaeota bacterium]|nr:PAS domain-containing protein [Candidatus Sumerlaeota bacterium]
MKSKERLAPIDVGNESLLRVLLSGLPYAVRVYDNALNCVMANDLGRTSEELRPFQSHSADPLHPGTPQGLREWPVPRALETGKPAEQEYVIERGEEEMTLFLEVMALPVPGPDGRAAFAVEITRDITDSALQTAKMKRLDGLLAEMVDQLSDVVETSDDLEGIPEAFNIEPQPDRCPNLVACPLFSPDPSAAAGSGTARLCSRCQIFQLTYPENLRRLTTSLDGLLLTLRRKHRQLLDSQREVFHAERLAAVGELVAGIAHDINNPVGVILSHLDALELEAEGQGLSPSLAEDLGVIRTHSQRIANTVEGLLRYCRKSPRRQSLGFDIRRVLRESLAFVGDTLSKRGIKIEADVGESPLPILGDPSALQQVFVNLLLNAADAMPEGGRVSIRSTLSDGKCPRALICIEDTGTGIAPEVMERIFDPFFTTKQSQGGTGLGLSICKRLIEELGGGLHVVSELGSGTAFTVDLPLHAEEEKRLAG